MPALSKWAGPASCLAGASMLAIQVYAYLDRGLLSSWLIGGGVGFLLVGVMKWIDYRDDQRSPTRIVPAADPEEPSVEEFDRHFDSLDEDAPTDGH